MDSRVVFLIGAPRSGTTMLERIISGHSQVMGGPEPHLLTPLAHLGVWKNVDKAPYDHIVAGIGQKDFIQSLPNRDLDYWHACNRYAQTLYNCATGNNPDTVYLDKTPEYATVWPFLKKVFPKAKYIVISRHPAAIFSSFANSFFEGDYALTQKHEPLFERYIPAISAMLQDPDMDIFHIRYEDLVSDPQRYAQELCQFLNLQFEPEMLCVDKSKSTSGLGDPIGIKKYKGLSKQSIERWAHEMVENPNNYQFLKNLLARISADDLATYGYAPELVWKPVSDLLSQNSQKNRQAGNHSSSWTSYKLQRKTIITLRNFAQNNLLFRNSLSKLRLACDVLLREY
ncbi:sulfotransferase [Alteromonas aestuariivivens]|uniref:Sulfotransferase n=1 Tax=Alteromonas aestuariivivens TaxID=1938339 RepID=A0A3D8MBA4_9ALTE|nr:sulfotransferase [Alteromonas aestuariivivens]RDV27497.1 sulfotransferase [Alteromonas aestuariivivens]